MNTNGLQPRSRMRNRGIPNELPAADTNTINSKITQRKPNAIVALCIVSESELIRAYPDYDASWETERPAFFKNMMYRLGADVEKPYHRQDGLKHRNRLNEVVVCSRWVFEERLDEAWINSGYASSAAKDKATGSRIIEDVYRSRGLTEDIQIRLEERDKYTQIDESVQVE